MKKWLLLLLCWGCVLPEAGSWGFWAHQQVNRVAVFTLPEELFPFFRYHLDYLTEHAVDPDKRRTSDPEEAPRHYIDLDSYGTHPFDSLPRRWQEAVDKYSEDTLKAYGIVPWQVQWMYYRLVEAYKERDKQRILKVAAELGHYIADAHVPLHTTLNYNGQLTGQHGIHGLLESRIPEIFNEDYDYIVGPAPLIEGPLYRIWEVVLQSAAAVDTVFRMEMETRHTVPEADWQVLEPRGNRQVKTYSRTYAAAYNSKLNGMVERRLRESILAVGSYWYSAWVEAGQPDLNALIDAPMVLVDSLLNNAETLRYRQGNFIGRPEAD
jgi:hypothetical protein